MNRTKSSIEKVVIKIKRQTSNRSKHVMKNSVNPQGMSKVSADNPVLSKLEKKAKQDNTQR